jgi:LmbE family N-acetylglucosaminyl deacetylase
MFRRIMPAVALLVCSGSAAFTGAPSAAAGDSVRVLIVVAHPDDDAMFAGTVYKLTHLLNGEVDLALVTDGSGGFRYAQLAEPVYGLRLTDETVARQYLPAIRKRELMAGGAIVGIRNYFFLDEYDHAYTENVDTVLTHVWDAGRVRSRLRRIMRERGYDFVFVHLPIEAFHGHHKAATILALEAAAQLDGDARPVVLGAFVGARGDAALLDFRGLPDYPITRIAAGMPPFVFDLTEPIDPAGRLDYRIVVNWLIAEHKSQGTMQLLMGRDGAELERYWYFAANPADGAARAERLFARLAEPMGAPGPRDAF